MLINDLLKQKKNLHFSLIDPDKQSPLESAKIARTCADCGTDTILIGGSTGISSDLLDKTAQEIKKTINLPVIIHPNSSNCLSKHADYILFMILLNSNNPKYLIKEQAKGALILNKLPIKPISVGYIVVSASKNPTEVERKGDLDKINETDINKALSYALAAQYLGMGCIYLEAGSGADKPVPNKMISAIKKEVNIPLIVGGGICDAATAKQIVESGADIIITGNIIEKDITKLKSIIKAIR